MYELRETPKLFHWNQLLESAAEQTGYTWRQDKERDIKAMQRLRRHLDDLGVVSIRVHSNNLWTSLKTDIEPFFEKWSQGELVGRFLFQEIIFFDAGKESDRKKYWASPYRTTAFDGILKFIESEKY